MAAIYKFYDTVRWLCKGELKDVIIRKFVKFDCESECLNKFIEKRKKGDLSEEDYKKIIMYMFDRKGASNKDVISIINCLISVIRHMMSKDKKLFLIAKEDLEKMINDTQYVRLSYSQWRKLMHIMIANGLIIAGTNCRKKLEQKVFNSKSVFLDKDRFALFYESGNFKKAKRLLETSIYFKIMKKVDIQSYQILYNSCDIPMGNGQIKEFEGVDKQFYKYSKDKTIAIIVAGYRENYSEIKRDLKEDDICALLSYLFDGTQKDIIDIKNPELVFYNVERFKNLLERDCVAPLNELRFVPQKYILLSKEEEKKIEHLKSKLRIMYPKELILYYSFVGSLNMLQCAILDLMFFDCKIKILNANLFLDRHQYMNGIDPFKDWYNRVNVFYMHDLIMNYRITRSLYKADLFTCDKTLKEILDNGEIKYIKGIEDIYLDKYFNEIRGAQ